MLEILENLRNSAKYQVEHHFWRGGDGSYRLIPEKLF